jgi:hypothetical protein
MPAAASPMLLRIARSSLRPVRRPRLRGRSAGVYGISGGRVAAASPSTVPSRVRAARAVRAEIPALAGRAFSHRVIPSVLSELSSLAPHAGRMNRRIRYSRLSCVLMPTSWMASHRSIHSLTVVFPAFVGPAALPDPGLLVASPGKRGGLGLEPGLAGFPAAGQPILDPPGLRALSALLRVGHLSGGPSAWSAPA